MTEEPILIRSIRPGDVPVHPIHADTLVDRLGMSKREHYAALLLAAMFSNPLQSQTNCSSAQRENMARIAVRSADDLVAMLAEADRGDA